MEIVKFNEKEHLSKVIAFYNDNAYQNDYVPFKNEKLFRKTIIENSSFKSEGFLLALSGQDIIGMALGIIDVNTKSYAVDEEIPGYINFLIVEKNYIGKGVRTNLLESILFYFKKNKVEKIHISHKSPIKLSWLIPNENAEHNKAPGVIVNSTSYRFFQEKGFEVLSYELSYFLDLNQFELNDQMENLKKTSREQGYEVVYFDKTKHSGQEEMFTRLKDESYREKFRKAQSRNEKIYVLVNGNEVCGITGHIYVEENGRGFFQGISVDPLHSGKKLGNLLFYSLCEELKNIGAKYMTLFVSEDNFAKNIYEKVGFNKVQRWAILAYKGEANEQ